MKVGLFAIYLLMYGLRVFTDSSNITLLCSVSVIRLQTAM